MRDKRQSIPPNVFSEEFLKKFSRRDETASSSEAELAGPWVVRPTGEGFGVFRQWEGDGAEPHGVLKHQEHALILAAVLPVIGREPLFHVDPTKQEGGGYALEAVWGDAWRRAIGKLRVFQEEVAETMHVVEAVLRSPLALAYLLEAAGATALRQAGEIFAQRLSQEEGGGDD